MEAATHPAGSNVIQSYGTAGFRINGNDYRTALLLTPATLVQWQGGTLTIESLAPLFEVLPKIETLIIGTGARVVPLPAELRQAARSRGVSLDAMDTGAACRTYNILLSENRRVGAALLLP